MPLLCHQQGHCQSQEPLSVQDVQACFALPAAVAVALPALHVLAVQLPAW